MYSYFSQLVTLTKFRQLSYISGLYIYRMVYNLVTLMVKLPQIWPVGATSVWLLCPFDQSPSYFAHFIMKIFRNTESYLFWVNTYIPINHILKLTIYLAFALSRIYPSSLHQSILFLNCISK